MHEEFRPKSATVLHVASCKIPWQYLAGAGLARRVPVGFVHLSGGLMSQIKGSTQLWLSIEVPMCGFSIKVQFSSVSQSCPTLCDPMNHSMPGLPIHHQLSECTQTHVHRVGDAIQPSHPLSSLYPPALNLSQHQDLFKWVSSLHQVAKILEFQLQHQSFQWIFRTDFL